MPLLPNRLSFRRLQLWAAVLACAVLLPGLLEAAPTPEPAANALKAACAADQQDGEAHDRQPQGASWEAIGRRDRHAMVLALVNAERLRLSFAIAIQGSLRFTGIGRHASAGSVN